MLRMQLAQEAFAHTAEYDDCIQTYLKQQISK
jgi:phosphoribosylaminoimidazolecarboxamide formyltransferase/IMP cyclohydrolase